ncbi:MAG: glycosyltransferase family 4 protein [Candidatus Paraprevotella stercoravium]|uniref:Glycosyltransferase family 4 protein n=1 Tax=Candidatus Paraprevotella stercoravium TaxID=2838725 RepID=A0A9E2P235_9BACT|nr:glycosyltransferase family 4 protein [Candidatus Paraprevotella stercoravium]
MKIIYCTHSVCNPGGMERVLANKVTYLVEKLHWDVSIVTTDQKNRPDFYPLPEGVRMTDLGINYSDDNVKHPIGKIFGYLLKRRTHRKRLTELLMREKADIVVSLYPSESSFIPKIKDGSKKVLELHYCKFFRLQYGRSGLLGWIDRWRTKQDKRIVSRFDKFVVLTKEDQGYWGNLPNIEVIPNAAKFMGNEFSDVLKHRVIAVGRLDYQKGFDRLIRAWGIIQQHERFKEWQLDIFGQGEWHDMLQQMIVNLGLSDTLHINKPTNLIGKEYAQSSLIVMTSNYEGFGMVLVEAMACGVPAIAFDCKCGPKDIINNNENGILVHNGDIQGLADAMMRLMEDENLRKRMSEEAKKVVDTYSEETVMKQWTKLFESLVEK